MGIHERWNEFMAEDQYGIDGPTAVAGIVLITGVAIFDGEVRQVLVEAVGEEFKQSRLGQRYQAALARRMDKRLAWMAMHNLTEHQGKIIRNLYD